MDRQVYLQQGGAGPIELPAQQSRYRLLAVTCGFNWAGLFPVGLELRITSGGVAVLFRSRTTEVPTAFNGAATWAIGVDATDTTEVGSSETVFTRALPQDLVLEPNAIVSLRTWGMNAPQPADEISVPCFLIDRF
jgi:hypothetical protein